MADLVYAFLDESPSLNSSDLFFCVAIILTDLSTQKPLAKILKKARGRLDRSHKTSAEIKFHKASAATKRYILSELANIDIEIVATVIDKNHRQVSDTPANYGLVIGAAVAQCLTLHPNLAVTHDRHYTNRQQYTEFVNSANQSLQVSSRKPSSVFFSPPADSQVQPLIQLADFVAGALNYKYNRKDSQYFNLIRTLIKKEFVFKWTELKRAATPGLRFSPR